MANKVKYPPKLSKEQTAFLLSEIKDWSILHGLALRPSSALVPDTVDPSGILAVTPPVTLFPSLFPRACFEEARAIQIAYNELYAAIARDETWLSKVLEELIEVDDFIKNLWDVHLAAKQAGYVQDISLGIFRSDYMISKDTLQTTAKIRQVEFNTIACGGGSLAAKVSALHRYLHSVKAYSCANNSLLRPAALPLDSSIQDIANGLALAHKAYGKSKSKMQLPLCIIFVVQEPERNIFDQVAISNHLHSAHRIENFRLPFKLTKLQTSITDDRSRSLIYTLPHSLSTRYEVTTLYFRAGYTPCDYTSPNDWQARLDLERSAAIKCPSILTQLAGSKKIQQMLTAPSPSLELFLSTKSSRAYIDRIRATFAAIYPLDDTPTGRWAIGLAKDPVKARRFVLKPQREGGGNNVYGDNIPSFLASLGNECNYRGYILMEIIEPPSVHNWIFSNGNINCGEVIGELGIYGICLWRKGDANGKGVEILENYEGGYMLRTKPRECEEGGVLAGFGAYDSVCLTEN